MNIKKHTKKEIKKIVEDFEQKCQPTSDEPETDTKESVEDGAGEVVGG
jgi:hypothetical protein